jgi:glycosyltransferase involved in cell wall biosynthesis
MLDDRGLAARPAGMKVVCVSSLAAGGPVTHMRDLLPRLVDAGVQVRVVCQTATVAEMFADVGIPADVSPLRGKWDLAGLARMRPLLSGADIVHTHDRRAWLLVGPLARALGMRLVHTYHGVPELLASLVGQDQPTARPSGSRVRASWLLSGHLRIEAWLARLGTVVVPSEAMARFLVQHGFPVTRLRVLHSRIDPRRCEPGPAHRPLAVGTAAVLAPHKGIDVLVSACARVTVPAHLHIYGDGELRAPLEAQALRLGVDATFHGWVGDLRDRLEDLDLFVLPSRGENLPISILEAMAAALPVVATRVGGVPELVVDGETGLLVDPDNVESLGGALNALAGDPERRSLFGRRAALRISQHYDAAAAGTAMLDVYRRLSVAPA